MKGKHQPGKETGNQIGPVIGNGSDNFHLWVYLQFTDLRRTCDIAYFLLPLLERIDHIDKQWCAELIDQEDHGRLRFLIIRAGLPPTTVPFSTSCSTTARAATTA